MRNLSYFTNKAQQQIDQSIIAGVPAKVRQISGGDVDGTAWRVDGWFERDLRAAIGPLGVKLGSLTQPT